MVGRQMGPYAVLSKLGEGGMGEVYRARDTKLNRDVAIKILPELFAADPDRLARFAREAQTLAALNHSNIAQIYGVLDLPSEGGSHSLVMEFVDGEDLSATTARGPMPVPEALGIARQIADALEAAHEHGIVHRDLKPANVKVKADGTVKVLDFGLAKAMDPGVGSDAPALNAVNSPTFTAHATHIGVILGTAAYMAPEQARGKAVDKRADIWAFGVVLFEMLTGRQTFGGETISEVMAAVMKDDPDWARLPRDLPPHVARLLRRCLAKDPKQRLRDIGDARMILDGADAPDSPAIDARSRPARRTIGLLPALAIAIIAMVVGGTAVRLWWPNRAAGSVVGSPHLSIALPQGAEVSRPDLAPIAISPGGDRIAYTVNDGRVARLFVRTLDDPAPKALPGTEGAAAPFFSPDGQWVGFFGQQTLRKITIGGTAIQTLCATSGSPGATWGTDGQIYFAPGTISGLQKVSENGGTPVEVTRLDRQAGEISHRWPAILPDAKTLLFTVWTGPGPDERQIVSLTLATGERQVLVRGGDRARYLPDGYITYARLDALLAVPWRPGMAPPAAAPISLSETAFMGNEGAAAYDVANGTLVSIAGGPARYAQRLVWVERSGKVDPLPLPERDYEAVSISPDGTQALVQIREGAMGLSLYDFARRTMTPLAVVGGSSQAGIWTPDGKRVVYRGTRGGHRNLYSRAADGTGSEHQITLGEGSQAPGSISPDGKWLVYHENTGGFAAMVAVRLDAPRPAAGQPVGEHPGSGPQLSPDGKWLAYVSLGSSRPEIFVQPFPGPGPRKQISTDGGLEPLWARKGHELFYVSGDALMGAAIHPGPPLSAGTPYVVARGRFRPGPNSRTAYDVAADGRFLRIQQIEPERPLDRIDVVLNWVDKLKAAARR